MLVVQERGMKSILTECARSGCLETFWRYPSQVRRGIKRFCSQSCASQTSVINHKLSREVVNGRDSCRLVYRTCLVCERLFTRKGCSDRRLYCSDICRSKQRVTQRNLAGKITEYRGQKFRSRSEARFARYCDDAGLQWEYELEAFRTPYGVYHPDFYLPELALWVEIKGYMLQYSWRKIEWFRQSGRCLSIVWYTDLW